MALKILQAGIQPIGQFDGYDAEVTLATGGFLGGEVCSLIYVATKASGGTDNAAADADGRDGYVGTTSPVRPAVTRTLADGTRPLFLSDDGASGYGTLFGELIGATVGQVGSGPGTGVQMGPHTAAGSGKITCWDKPGLYAVTLDAVVDGTAGLDPLNGTLAGGDPLYATATGQLTPVAANDFDTTGVVVARFIEFQTNGSLVTTPNTLVSALNSPTGGVAARANLTQAVIHFNPEL